MLISIAVVLLIVLGYILSASVFSEDHSASKMTLIWGTSSWTCGFDEIHPDVYRRGAINTTDMEDSFQFKIPEDQVDPGKCTIKIHFNPDNPPPFTATNETFTILYPPLGTGTYTATSNRSRDAVSAFITSLKPRLVRNTLMVADLEVEFSGAITHTNAT